MFAVGKGRGKGGGEERGGKYSDKSGVYPWKGKTQKDRVIKGRGSGGDIRLTLVGEKKDSSKKRRESRKKKNHHWVPSRVVKRGELQTG